MLRAGLPIISRFIMPATRSSSRLAAATASGTEAETPKRKAAPTEVPAQVSAKKPRVSKAKKIEASTPVTAPLLQIRELANAPEDKLVPAKLTFSFEEAKAHLINADQRFEDVFNLVTCKPFEHLKALHPFQYVRPSIFFIYIAQCDIRELASSIL